MINAETSELIDHALSIFHNLNPIHANIFNYQIWLDDNLKLKKKLLGANLFCNDKNLHKFIHLYGSLKNLMDLQSKDVDAFKAIESFTCVSSKNKASVYKWLLSNEGLHRSITFNFDNPIVDGYYLFIEDPIVYIDMKDYYNIYSFLSIYNYLYYPLIDRYMLESRKLLFENESFLLPNNDLLKYFIDKHGIL